VTATTRPGPLPDRLKEAVKPFLVPIWNGAASAWWVAYDYAVALSRCYIGGCIVCGRFGFFFYRRRVVTRRLQELWGLSPRLAAALAWKESGDCSHCGAKLRARRMAQVVLGCYPTGKNPVWTLADWVRAPNIQELRVAEINQIDGVHTFIKQLPHYSGSDFRETGSPARSAPESRSEDLTHLSYQDNSFDLILTSETLEHVPDYMTALRETHRVLAPGGRHIFTVPVLPATRHTYARAIIRPDGSIEDRAARIAHPGGDWGYPVFTEFGTDLPQILREIGFDTELLYGPVSEDNLAQVYVARKRLA
jgi:SAM-dependent methyltransferase